MNWSKKTWIWIFAILAVAILAFLFFVLKGKAQGNNGNGSKNGTKTDCCGTISDCYGLSNSEVEDLQTELNSRGCTDFNGSVLTIDGECGPKTNSAIKKCK